MKLLAMARSTREPNLILWHNPNGSIGGGSTHFGQPGQITDGSL